MEYRTWLFRSYKTGDGELLDKETVEQYCAAFEDLKVYLKKIENITLTSLSTTDMKKLLIRLDNDKVVRNLPKGQNMVHALDLYIQFREREQK